MLPYHDGYIPHWQEPRPVSDELRINIVETLCDADYINEEERDSLEVVNGVVFDDTRCPVELSENGSVYIHRTGSPYPITLVKFF